MLWEGGGVRQGDKGCGGYKLLSEGVGGRGCEVRSLQIDIKSKGAQIIQVACPL